MWCIILFLRWQKMSSKNHPCWPSSERETVLQEMWDSFHQHIQRPKTWKTAAWQTGTNDMHWFCEWNICDNKRISWDETTNTCANVFCFQIVHLWSAGMHRIHEDCCKQWKPWEIMFSLRKDQDSNIKINIRNVLKCLPLYLLLYYYFPINYRNTNKKLIFTFCFKDSKLSDCTKIASENQNVSNCFGIYTFFTSFNQFHKHANKHYEQMKEVQFTCNFVLSSGCSLDDWHIHIVWYRNWLASRIISDSHLKMLEVLFNF